jgi:hypothetical protein
MLEDEITQESLKILFKRKLKTKPVIEEDVQEVLYGEFPPVIVLSKGKLLKECRKCGYLTQVWVNQNWCPNFKCRAEDLTVLDIDEYNKSQADDHEHLMKNLPRILDCTRKDVGEEIMGEEVEVKEVEHIDIIKDVD